MKDSPGANIEIGRTTSLAMASLFALGIEHPRQHIILATAGQLATLIVSPQPFSAADISTLTGAIEKLHFQILASPDAPSLEPVIKDLLSATNTADLDARGERYLLDVSAPTDSRPFFFNQIRLLNWNDISALMSEYKVAGLYFKGNNYVVFGNFIALGTLALIIVLSAIAVVFVVILPARSTIHAVERRLAYLGSTYFMLIGLGFMFVEIGLIQRTSVFIGHPVYGLGVVLFSIILSTGIGSLLSNRFLPRSPFGILLWVMLIAGYLASVPVLLPAITHSSLESAELPVRALVSVAMIMPAGLLMGFGFPMGMRLVVAWDSRPTPWFWGVNGAAGVLAAGLAVACSLGFSIDVTIRVGAVCYLLLAPIALLLLKAPANR